MASVKTAILAGVTCASIVVGVMTPELILGVQDRTDAAEETSFDIPQVAFDLENPDSLLDAIRLVAQPDVQYSTEGAAGLTFDAVEGIVWDAVKTFTQVGLGEEFDLSKTNYDFTYIESLFTYSSSVDSPAILWWVEGFCEERDSVILAVVDDASGKVISYSLKMNTSDVGNASDANNASDAGNEGQRLEQEDETESLGGDKLNKWIKAWESYLGLKFVPYDEHANAQDAKTDSNASVDGAALAVSEGVGQNEAYGEKASATASYEEMYGLAENPGFSTIMAIEGTDILVSFEWFENEGEYRLMTWQMMPV